jgi:glycosyltransferase involved in cell wall biosynthesis/SAM-dependent methyltransferase
MEQDLTMGKNQVITFFDETAGQRDAWKAKNIYYHLALEKLCASLVPPGASVMEIGCSTGDLLAAVHPERGVGLDISSETVKVARCKHPQYEFLVGDAEALPLDEKFDYILMSDLVGYLDDIWRAFHGLHGVCHPGTRMVITLYNWMWEPILSASEKLGLKMPDGVRQNWVSVHDVKNLLYLTDFEVERVGSALLVPKPIPLLSTLNRLENSRLLGQFALIKHLVAKPKAGRKATRNYTCSIIIPTRNERDNIEGCITRPPMMGRHTELIFVDGDSTDGTIERIEEMIEQHPELDIKLIHQVPRPEKHNTVYKESTIDTPANLMLALGKGDAVRKGFAVAKGDVLMILDSDLTVPPEDLPKFFDALASGKTRFVNGTRLVYPMEDEAMKRLNRLGNVFFSVLFTWLLEQRITDTLCGTKVLLKDDYEAIAGNRSYFGDLDPFGDFDLLFGAAYLGLSIVDVPVRYRRRTAGESKLRVFKHGLLLIRMSVVAFIKLKLAKWLGRR